MTEEIKTIQVQDNDFLVWDKLFSKLAWKFKPTKSGDMLIDAEAVYEELKNEFNLTLNNKNNENSSRMVGRNAYY